MRTMRHGVVILPIPRLGGKKRNNSELGLIEFFKTSDERKT